MTKIRKMAHKAKFNSMLYRREKLKTQQSEKAKNEGTHTLMRQMTTREQGLRPRHQSRLQAKGH